MKYIATIEIPKNSERRIHKATEAGIEGKFVDFGPISDKITANGGKMPVAYGFIEKTINKGENDELDVMVFSEKEFKTEDSVEVTPFAMMVREEMVREDGDHKVLAHDDTLQINSFEDLPETDRKTLMDFNGFKLPIVKVENAEDTIKYIESVKLP